MPYPVPIFKENRALAVSGAMVAFSKERVLALGEKME